MACSVFRSPQFISSFSRSSRAIFRAEITPKIPIICASVPILEQPHRPSSFRSSPVVRELQEYPEVEIVRNPPEWKYVERLLAPKIVPQAPKQGDNFSSGWRPQKKYDPKVDKYFIKRTRNYMIPVYLMTSYRATRQITVIRCIEGDIWSLEKDLRRVIEDSQNGLICASQVNEMSGRISFHGNYVDLVKDHLQEMGF